MEAKPKAKPDAKAKTARSVSKHELWMLAGETAAKLMGLAALLQHGGVADIAVAKDNLLSLSQAIRVRRGPNPAERIPPRQKRGAT